jgi:hypothetical protein
MGDLLKQVLGSKVIALAVSITDKSVSITVFPVTKICSSGTLLIQ